MTSVAISNKKKQIPLPKVLKLSSFKECHGFSLAEFVKSGKYLNSTPTDL